MPNGNSKPTQEVTLYDVYHRLGQLEGALDTLSKNIGNVQAEQTLINTKMENIASVANQPHVCLNGERIKTLEGTVGNLDRIAYKAIGGKTMLVFLIMLFVSVMGTSVGAYISYKSAQKVDALESRVEEVKKEVGEYNE